MVKRIATAFLDKEDSGSSRGTGKCGDPLEVMVGEVFRGDWRTVYVPRILWESWIDA